MDGLKKAYNKSSAIFLKVGYESMSALSPPTEVEVNLPHFSYIVCKSIPPGIYFNTLECFVTLVFLVL